MKTNLVKQGPQAVAPSVPEHQIAASEERSRQEIQASIAVAKRYPRDEDQTYARLLKACKRSSFAEQCSYSFPRGRSTVTGPSVNLAREAARVYGNIVFGIEIVRDLPESRQIRGYAFDLETNLRVVYEDTFEKLIQRKRGGKTVWEIPDERDLRELQNRRGAILVRNCILQIVPRDFIEDALIQARETMAKATEQDPDAARKGVIKAFSSLNVGPDLLKAILGHSIDIASPDELTKLREIFKSIEDGQSTIGEYLPTELQAAEETGGTAVPKTLRDVVAQKEAEKKK